MIKVNAMVFAGFLALAGCDEHMNSDKLQRAQQEQLSMQAAQTVGMPAINDFAEKRMAKDILELRDKMVPTVTYIVDMNNRFRKLCDSVGFGLPYATQYTNPQRIATTGTQGIATLPQADPNGLFSPTSAEGTWVLCLNPATKKLQPVYVEPRVIVSPFALE